MFWNVKTRPRIHPVVNNPPRLLRKSVDGNNTFLFGNLYFPSLRPGVVVSQNLSRGQLLIVNGEPAQLASPGIVGHWRSSQDKLAGEILARKPEVGRHRDQQ